MNIDELEIVEISIKDIVGPVVEVMQQTDILYESNSFNSLIASQLSKKIKREIVELSNFLVCRGRDKKYRYITCPFEINLAASIDPEFRIRAKLVHGLNRKRKCSLHMSSVLPFLLYKLGDEQNINDLLNKYIEVLGKDVFSKGGLRHEDRKKIIGVGRKKYCYSRRLNNQDKSEINSMNNEEDITERLDLINSRDDSNE